MTFEKRAGSVGTHDGTFHADEVTACALLILYDCVQRERIVRTRDPDLLAQCEFVCDVGGEYDPSRKLFDHHQSTYEGKLSSAGMIVRWLESEELMPAAEAEYFRLLIIDGVDAHDIGEGPLTAGLCTFSHVISQFAPISYESSGTERDGAFLEAVDFTLSLLGRMRDRFRYVQSCRSIVADVMRTSDLCLEFDRSLPWLEPFFDLGGERHPALFVLMPTGEHWKLRAIPPSYEERMGVRQALPEAWGGLLEDDLRRISGIDGAIFCHKGLFISVWETREDAVKALEICLKRERGN